MEHVSPNTAPTALDLRKRAGTSTVARSVRSRCASCGCADAQGSSESFNHEITLGEEEIADVSLATFYVFDKENAGPSRRSERLACGCWTGTYYTSGNDAYPTPLRPVTQPHGHVPKHVPKSPRQARSGSSHPLSTRQCPALIEVADGLVTASLPTNQQEDDIVGDLFDSNLV